MNVLRVVTVIGSFFSLVLVILAVATDYWMNDYTGHVGLWKFCLSGKCDSFGMDVKGTFHAVRAFILIGMTLCAFAFTGICATFYYLEIGPFSLFRVVAIIHFCAGICILIAMVTFRAAYGGYSYFGLSFYSGWVSIVLAFLVAARCFRLQIASEYQSI